MPDPSKRQRFVKRCIVALVVLCLSCVVFVGVSYFRHIENVRRTELLNSIIEHGGIINLTDDTLFYGSDKLYAEKDICRINQILFSKRFISSQEIKCLGTLKELKKVHFFYCGITDNEVKAIAENLEHIEMLYFAGNKLSTDCGRYLKKMKKLWGLGIEQSDFTDECLRQFKGIDLKFLMFANTPISEIGLNSIGTIQKLELIVLNNTHVTDDIYLFINLCPNLWAINITDVPIECNFIRSITNVREIAVINLHNTALNDDTLINVTKFPKLNGLVITGCKVTEQSNELIETLEKRGVDVVR